MNYTDLLGKFINKIKEDEYYVYFITADNLTARIPKFEPYCTCNVGEYIDEIMIDGACFGVITSIETDITGTNNNWYDPDEEIVYKGNVTFFFQNGKLKLNVHGEDNGFYGVNLTLPVEIIKGEVKRTKEGDDKK